MFIWKKRWKNELRYRIFQKEIKRNNRALLEKITELNTEINKTRDSENLIDWDKLTYTEEKIVSDMIHLRNKMQLSHNERFDSYYRI